MAHRGRFRTAPIITVIIQVTTLKPPTCGIMHNQFKAQKFKHLMLAMGSRDLNSAPCSPVHCSSHSMTSFQSSELTELPVVENSQLFAQRAHNARYAPIATDLCFLPCLLILMDNSFVAINQLQRIKQHMEMKHGPVQTFHGLSGVNLHSEH